MEKILIVGCKKAMDDVCIGLRRSWKLLWQGVLTMDKLDAFLDNLQNEIFEEARQALGEKGFHRWRDPDPVGPESRHTLLLSGCL